MKNPKSTHLTVGILILTILLQGLNTAKGQNASAYWPLTKDNQGVSITGNINTAGLINTGLNMSYTSTCISISYITGSLNPDKYLQFEIAPISGHTLQVNELSSYFYAISYSCNVQIHCSLSSDFSDYQIIAPQFSIPLSEPTLFSYSNLNLTVSDGNRLYIRIFAYYGGQYTNLRMKDFTISGNTTPLTSLAYEKETWCTGEVSADAIFTGPEGGTFSASPQLPVDPSTGRINLTGSNPGHYTISYSVSDEVLASTDIVILQSPACTISDPEGPVFSLSTHTFSAPNDMTFYEWLVTGDAEITGNSSEQTVVVRALDSGVGSFTLSLTVQEDNLCTSTCTKVINVEELEPGMLPTATLTGTQSICVGKSADLVVNLTGQPPWSFTWTDGENNYTVQETNTPQHIITVYPTHNTTYSLTELVTDGTSNSNTGTGEAKIYFGPITSAPEIIACPNTTIVEVPITVKSFNEVRDISLTLEYDPGVMTYQDFEIGAIGSDDTEIGDIQVSDYAYESLRTIRISKISGKSLPNLPDNAELLRLIFSYHGGNTDLKWVDSPDDVWCSYSYMSAMDESGFETEVFCDIPTKTYYVNGSVKQLSVSGTDMNAIADISTISGTPVIIPVSVKYPDLAAQEVSPEVLTDTRISFEDLFPEGARVFNVTYNGVAVLSSPYDLGEKQEVLLSEILGTAATPLLNHSGQTINWEFYVDGITSPVNVPVKVEALAYTNLNECVTVLANKSFTITFADATLTVPEFVNVCGTESLQFTAEIGYPEISNMNTAIKADAKISAVFNFPEGTIINWNYNSSDDGSYTLPVSTNELMLSAITGTEPSPVQGHTGNDEWLFEIRNAGLMSGNVLTIEAVAVLDGQNYIYADNQVILTVNPLPEVIMVSLQASTDESTWTTVSGTIDDGYEMCADPGTDYHYLDIDVLTSSLILNSEFENNPFYLDTNTTPTGFYEYWNERGVNNSAEGWQAEMWKIIIGAEPMFYISYNGTDYKLIDGLQYQHENITSALRISGDYPPGDYAFSGSVTDINDCESLPFKINLKLNSAPVITCPSDISVNNYAGTCEAEVSFEATASGTPVPAIVYTLSDNSIITSPHTFPVGTSTIMATASADCKTVSCTFNVTVNDTEAPVISLLGDASIILCENEIYTDAGVSATDNCDGDLTASVATVNPVNTNVPGIYMITYDVSDAALNTADQVTRTVTVHPLPEVTEVNLQTSTDENSWFTVSGNIVNGFELCVDPAAEFHYFGVDDFTSSVELMSSAFEQNAFYLNITTLPAGFFDYWNSKGVNASATDGWQAEMWKIINGVEPMFYISYNGTDLKLIDGFRYRFENVTGTLRISGDYPAGDYTFSGTVTDFNGCVSLPFDVNLKLNSAPAIDCPGDIETENDLGECGAAVYFAVTATGTPVPEIIYRLSDGSVIQSGHFFTVGITAVTATAGNDCKTADCTFNVTVTDDEAPEITCPVNENIDVIKNNANTYVHSGTGWDASASDNCSEENPVFYTLSGETTGTGISLNGITFNQGATTVTWKATDTAGNFTLYSFTVTVLGVNVTGTVNYYNKFFTPLDAVTLKLLEAGTGNLAAQTETNVDGEYSFANLIPGIYDVIIETDKPMRSINSTDAGQVNAWNVAQSGSDWPSIEKVRFLAGNVNEDNSINSGDAGLIQNYFLILGTEQIFDKSWEFWKTNDSISTQPQLDNILQIEIPTGNNKLIQDFYGLVSGDFDRSNVPASNTTSSLIVKSARSDVVSVTLLKGDSIFADSEGMIELPIRAVSAMQVGAISLILNYPTERLQVVDVYLKDNYNHSAGFNTINNMLVIGWNSVNPLSLKAGEPLVTVKLKIKGEDQGIPLYFELANNPLNELADENMIAMDNVLLIMDGIMMKETITGIEETDHLSFKLSCFPNPFGNNSKIRYTLPCDGRVNMEVTGILGEKIRILSDEKQIAGEYLIDFNGTNLVPGVYHVALRLTGQNGQPQVKTATLIKH